MIKPHAFRMEPQLRSLRPYGTAILPVYPCLIETVSFTTGLTSLGFWCPMYRSVRVFENLEGSALSEAAIKVVKTRNAKHERVRTGKDTLMLHMHGVSSLIKPYCQPFTLFGWLERILWGFNTVIDIIALCGMDRHPAIASASVSHPSRQLTSSTWKSQMSLVGSDLSIIALRRLTDLTQSSNIEVF